MEPGQRRRGRGRGRVYPQDPEPQPQPGPSRGRGRGASRTISADPSPISLPENPADDDFIAAFRRLHPQLGGGGMDRGKDTWRVATMSVPSTSEDSGFVSQRSGILSQVETRQPSPTVPNVESIAIVKRGERGRPVTVATNYLRLSLKKNMGIYEYHVDFEPDLDSRKAKKILISSLADEIGNTWNFDGSKLYLATQLAQTSVQFSLPHPFVPEDIIAVKIKFVKENSLADCAHFYNVLFRRIMTILGMVEMKRNFYDYRAVHELPRHKLEIWPGFVTAIDEYEGGLMLCCDSTFRVRRTETVLEILERFHTDDRPVSQVKQAFTSYMLGKIVMTKYNLNFRVDDIAWNLNPKCTFTTKRGEELTYIEYYARAYQLQIQNLNQPLLVHRPKPLRNREVLPVINLIPELCYVTGMDADITSQYTVMRDMAQFTKLTPADREFALQQFARNVNENDDAKLVLSRWGLSLDDASVKIEGRVLTIPTVTLKPGIEFTPDSANFNEVVMKNSVYTPISVTTWQIYFADCDRPKAMSFVEAYQHVSRAFGISVAFSQNQAFPVGRGNLQDFRKALERHLNPKAQFIVCIIPSQRDDVYAAIKQICTTNVPIPSQVILSKTLASEKKFRAVVQKIALQINCKIGGALWVIRIPLPEKILFLGMDVYHDPRRRNSSVTGIVASLNSTFTKYYSRVIFQSRHQETVNSMVPILTDLFVAFAEENNGCFPDRVIVWRDGVGDGQLYFTKEHEVAQVTQAMELMSIRPKFTFCVVQKRINARLFLQGRHGPTMNPEPGTVVDHTITRKCFYDFFLVSQLVRDGTVSPTHFVVLEDNSSIPPDLIQKFAFATTFMYYNWPGSVRVPAMCQYAHKLASLVGQHTHAEPAMELAKNLYYL